MAALLTFYHLDSATFQRPRSSLLTHVVCSAPRQRPESQHKNSCSFPVLEFPPLSVEAHTTPEGRIPKPCSSPAPPCVPSYGSLSAWGLSLPTILSACALGKDQTPVSVLGGLCPSETGGITPCLAVPAYESPTNH